MIARRIEFQANRTCFGDTDGPIMLVVLSFSISDLARSSIGIRHFRHSTCSFFTQPASNISFPITTITQTLLSPQFYHYGHIASPLVYRIDKARCRRPKRQRGLTCKAQRSGIVFSIRPGRRNLLLRDSRWPHSCRRVSTLSLLPHPRESQSPTDPTSTGSKPGYNWTQKPTIGVSSAASAK